MNISAFNRYIATLNGYTGLLCSLILLITTTAHATNTASEKRWAEQLRDQIVVGEARDLPLSGASGEENTFFSIYTPHTSKTPKGAVVLMHGKGAHPDWNDVIHPLRTELPDKGWASLSIQMPLTLPDKNDADSLKQVIEASVARIDAAVNFLRSQSYQHVVLIAHSFGSLMALNYLQQKAEATTQEGQPLINAAIIIGTSSQGPDIPLNASAMIEKIKIPLLDLYGSNDHRNVRSSAKTRKAAAHKAANQHYRQTVTIGANHFYHGLDEELVRYSYHWLNKAVKPR